VREKAAGELEKLGEPAVPLLRELLKSDLTTEAAKRVQALLKKWEGPAVSPYRLRVLRALEALEHAGTLEAARVLDLLARTGSDPFLQREALAAVRRLPGAPAAP
jgi:hypothetical protein